MNTNYTYGKTYPTKKNKGTYNTTSLRSVAFMKMGVSCNELL